MKNLNYFPCERNKYFYGKLLSVDDFESEQKYMNDKRRLINRFLHGCGVACGLNVIPVSEDTVSIEAGMALDFSGREIIVDKPVLKKLTDIEGFYNSTQENGNDTYQYLCIEYQEYEKEPVYGMAGGIGQGEQVCYNKIAEGYHIYLTGREPEQAAGGDAYYERWEKVYWGNGIRISQVFPRYVKSGSEFDMRIVVENMGQRLPVSFGYELVFDCMEKDRKKWMKISFDEKQQERERRYEISIALKASEVKGVKAEAVMREDSFWLNVGEYPVEASAWVKSTVEITEEDVKTVIDRHYYEDAMQEILNNTYHQSIYLAKINMVWAGSTVVIEDVEQMPFRQYISSDALASVRERAAEEELNYLRRCVEELISGGSKTVLETKPAFSESLRTAEGVVTIKLGIGGMAGQKFFSEPIAHGLGLGNTAILCGILYGDGESRVCYGADSVFEDQGRIRADVAASADTQAGTFVVGLKLTEPTTAESVKIYWMAMQDKSSRGEDGEKRAIFLKPDMVYLSLREEYYFEPVFTGSADKRVTWSVREERGGNIDENGMYTAPNVPGIYEIVARSVAHPDLTATAFAVVRDLRKN